jgi:hypothetical protein
MFAEVAAKAGAERGSGGTPARGAAAAALERFLQRSRDARGAAILARDQLVAASGDERRWAQAARELAAAADAGAPGGRASSAHVATERGEAFLLRRDPFAMVAVCQRFALASLVLTDMRAALRELAEASD